MEITTLEHLTELKKRILLCVLAFILLSCVSYFFAEGIFNFLIAPLEKMATKAFERKFIYTNLSEVFFSYLKLAMFAGFIFSFPIFASQIYLFIAPGLYKQEKRTFLPFIILSPILFLLGSAFAYYFIFPLAWKFFLSFETVKETAIPILLEAKVSEYIALVMSFIIAFGLAFQLPLFLLLLVSFNFIDKEWLVKKRKLAIVAIFIVAAVITPPDIISQIALAIPMVILYELAIMCCRYIKN
jgi:sec-independent protein translocase protein TatC